MADTLYSICLSIMDPLLGWMLHLPRDLILFAVAIGTALILTGVRVFTTDQNLLKRCKDDKARLKELIREAKRNRDKEALARHRVTVRQIGVRNLQAEGKPLLAALLPIALLAIWCFSRIAYLPPSASDSVVVKAYFPVSGIGNLVHIVPEDGLRADAGWIQRVTEDEDEPSGTVTNGIAGWTLWCEKRGEPYVLLIRYMGKTFAKELIADGLHYAAPLQAYGDGAIEVVEIVMPEYRLFGVVPGLPWIMVQPWIVGYLIITIPSALILRRVLRIH